MELAIQSRKLVSDGSDYLGKARNGNPILRFYVRKSALRDWVESEGMRKPGFLYPEGSNPLDQPKAIQERKLKSQREETLLKTIGLLAYLYVEAKKDSQDFGTPEKPNKSAVIRKAHALMSTLGVDDDGLKPSNLDAILNQAYESIGLNLKK